MCTRKFKFHRNLVNLTLVNLKKGGSILSGAGTSGRLGYWMHLNVLQHLASVMSFL